MQVLLVFLCCVIACVHSQGCAPTYSKYTSHTMCIYNAAACPGLKLIRSGNLTSGQMNEIVNIHNKLRASLVAGTVKGQPKAASMAPMSWDSELATVAQRVADQCRFQHDLMRDVPRFKVGQNIYIASRQPAETANTPNMTEAAMAWWNEVYVPGFKNTSINPFVFSPGAGHYTQMAWYTTTSIGCGYTMFLNTTSGWSSKLYYCNYGPAGNVINKAMYIKA